MIDLYPSIDLLGGRVVRLRQGDYDDVTDYGDDPVSVALEFAQAGVRWVHVVDLDAAKSGDPVNRPVGRVDRVGPRRFHTVQTGGGVRTLDDAPRTRRGGRRSRRDGIRRRARPGARGGGVRHRSGRRGARPS